MAHLKNNARDKNFRYVPLKLPSLASARGPTTGSCDIVTSTHLQPGVDVVSLVLVAGALILNEALCLVGKSRTKLSE